MLFDSRYVNQIFNLTKKLMTSLSDLELQELDGYSLKKNEMKALQCFRQVRLKKLQNIFVEDQYHIEYENLRLVSATMDYREFLTQNCNSNT